MRSLFVVFTRYVILNIVGKNAGFQSKPASILSVPAGNQFSKIDTGVTSILQHVSLDEDDDDEGNADEGQEKKIESLKNRMWWQKIN